VRHSPDPQDRSSGQAGPSAPPEAHRTPEAPAMNENIDIVCKGIVIGSVIGSPQGALS
jgi:hypothetical protein